VLGKEGIDLTPLPEAWIPAGLVFWAEILQMRGLCYATY